MVLDVFFKIGMSILLLYMFFVFNVVELFVIVLKLG